MVRLFAEVPSAIDFSISDKKCERRSWYARSTRYLRKPVLFPVQQVWMLLGCIVGSFSKNSSILRCFLYVNLFVLFDWIKAERSSVFERKAWVLRLSHVESFHASEVFKDPVNNTLHGSWISYAVSNTPAIIWIDFLECIQESPFIKLSRYFFQESWM